MVFGPAPEGDASVVISITADTREVADKLNEIEKMAEEAAKAAGHHYTAFVSGFEMAMKRVSEIAIQTGRSVQEVGSDFDLLKSQVTQSDTVIQQLGQHFNATWADTKKGAEEANTSAQNLLKTLKQIAGIGSAIAIFRQLWTAFTNTIKESVAVFGEATIAQFKFEVGVRAAQRLVGEAAGTMEEWTGFVQDLREQFQIFSTKDITAATAKVILLTRELGFTAEQMQETTKASIILAEVSGFKVEEAARRLALFLDTGYTRGLAQLGLQISKTTVEQYALANGIEKTWNEMTRAERASLGLAVVLEQTGRLADDAGRIIETYQGQMMALEAAQTDAMVALGEDAAFLTLAWARVKTFVIEKVLPDFIKGLKNLVKSAIEDIGDLIEGFAQLVSFVTRLNEMGLKEFAKDFKNQFTLVLEDGARASQMFVDQLNKELFPAYSEFGNETSENFGIFGEEIADAEGNLDSFSDALKKLGDTLEREYKRMTEGIEKAIQDRDRAIEKLNEDFAYDLIDAARDLGFKLVDIDRKFADRREDAWRKYYDDIAMLSWNTNNKIAEAQAEFRLNELQEQREFDLEMQRMQRKYLFDLEDAVRERDARAVINIMRRFQMDRQQAIEEFELRRREREEELAQDIAMIRRQEEIRRMELKRSLEIRLRDLEIQRIRERAAAREAYQRELNDIFENEARRREAIRKLFDQRVADLRANWKKVNDEALALLIETHDLTEEGMRAIINGLRSRFGFLANETATFIQLLVNTLRTAEARLSAATTQYPGYNVQAIQSMRGTTFGSRAGTGIQQFQHGGGMVASRPTTVQFGEAGPELGSFIPLNKLGQVLGGAGGGAQIELTVKADDGFIVEVSDQVMGEMADVIVNTERGR